MVKKSNLGKLDIENLIKFQKFLVSYHKLYMDALNSGKPVVVSELVKKYKKN